MARTPNQLDDGMGSGGYGGKGIPGQTRRWGAWMPASEQVKTDYMTTLNNPQMINPQLAITDPRGTMADITRGQWEEFQSTSVPIIKQLEGMTTYGGNAGVVEGLKTEARENAKAAFNSVLPDAQRQAQSYGMSLSPSTAGTLERSAKLGMAAATVDGVNRANTYQRDLNRQIAAGSNLSTVGSK